MSWHFRVMNIAAKAKPPKEWEEILKFLKGILPSEYINKIEVAAFAIPKKRTARWKVKRGTPEYKYFSRRPDALEVARKLTWLLLKTKNSPSIPRKLKILLNKRNKFINKITYCPICRRLLNFQNFKLFGRKDPSSIQIGHLIPLSRLSIGKGHNAQNVVWVHRRCNDLQDEETVDETIETFHQILKRHGYKISKN